MTILGFDLTYRRAVLYKKINAKNSSNIINEGKEKIKGNTASNQDKKFQKILKKGGISIVEVKFRQWWSSWYSAWYLAFLIIPLIFIPYFIYKKKNAKSKIKKFLLKGYIVSDDIYSKTIVVQFCGLPLENKEKEIIYNNVSSFWKLKKDLSKYKKNKMSEEDKKDFIKNSINYYNEYEVFLDDTKIKKEFEKIIEEENKKK